MHHYFPNLLHSYFPKTLHGCFPKIRHIYLPVTIGPMQVVSGALGKGKVHFQAPDSILVEKEYYEILEKTQKGNLDITGWIQWFLNCLINALKSTDSLLIRVLFKADFWTKETVE